MAHGKGTAHHKLHGLVGWGLIIGLPFAIGSAVGAIGGGADGFKAWLSTPLVWYVKLEMDEVIMDYFGGGARSFGLLANRLAALIVWAMMAYVVIKLAFMGA